MPGAGGRSKNIATECSGGRHPVVLGVAAATSAAVLPTKTRLRILMNHFLRSLSLTIVAAALVTTGDAEAQYYPTYGGYAASSFCSAGYGGYAGGSVYSAGYRSYGYAGGYGCGGYTYGGYAYGGYAYGGYAYGGYAAYGGSYLYGGYAGYSYYR
jgi:hypothetical protein